MKTLNAYISERLVLSKNKKTPYTLFPKTTEELQQMIDDADKIEDIAKNELGDSFGGK